jgi:quinohemoprotein ethanol dehydrogenase
MHANQFQRLGEIEMIIRNRARASLCLSVSAILLSVTVTVTYAAEPANVDAARLNAVEREPEQWLSVGRNPEEQRFSPLKQITTDNIGKLALTWFADYDSNRGQEGTPLFIDGVLYVSTAWSRVKAYDARTGKQLWSYDPKVPGEFAGRGCCDVVNRGLAAWKGRIYVASYDGRLIALDARDGREVWSVLTVDHSKPYTITGAPRVVKGKVLIGNGGAELGVRGYVTAYDAETGKQAWRFYTVPGDPALGFESPALKKAASTWNGQWWTAGGGGTVWDAMAYDPKSNLVYIGVGNGSPWNQKFRSPGGGDNLFLASIVALKPETGEYVWHYQTTPAETWDYTATQHIMVADLKIDGRERRVVMQAPKNGFFYVLDAKTGKFISANNYVEVNWADGIDPKSGRPIERLEARYDRTGKPALVQPSPQGAHSWHPMSFNPQTGLVYFSAVDTSMAMMSADKFEYRPMATNLGVRLPVPPELMASLKGRTGPSQSRLVAWDPVKQKEAWRSDVRGGIGAGTLSTAGGLVFQGTTPGRLVAYRATTGEELWSFEAQTGLVAAPLSYELDGEQYVAMSAGYGLSRYGQSNRSRLLVFKLGGTASLPPAPPPPPALVLNPPELTASAEVVERGREAFANNCMVCHEPPAANRAAFPDLRYSAMLHAPEGFSAVVIGGALQANGMASFRGRVSEDEVQAIRAYLVKRANDVKAGKEPGAR